MTGEIIFVILFESKNYVTKKNEVASKHNLKFIILNIDVCRTIMIRTLSYDMSMLPRLGYIAM